MRKIKEVLRLRFGLGLQTGADRPQLFDRPGDRSSISGKSGRYRSRVGRCRTIATTSGSMSFCFRPRPVWPASQRTARRGFRQIHRQLQTHRHLTLQLVWEEYRETHPDGYSYSRFCELYQRWNRNQDVVLRQEHHAGEKMFVDWAGDTVPDLRSADTGESRPLRSSSPCSAPAPTRLRKQRSARDLPNWIDCHVRAFEYFQGTTKLSCPITRGPASTRACRYEPDLNRTYHEMAQHYGVAVMPATALQTPR